MMTRAASALKRSRAASTSATSAPLCLAGVEPANAGRNQRIVVAARQALRGSAWALPLARRAPRLLGFPRSQRPRPRLAIDCGTPIASSSPSSVRVASSAVAMQATPMAIKISTVIIAVAILLSSVDRITDWCFACEVLPTSLSFSPWIGDFCQCSGSTSYA
jgi:hypothetical protein